MPGIWLSSDWPTDAGARDPTTGGQLIIVQHTSYVGAAAAAAYVQHCILLWKVAHGQMKVRKSEQLVEIMTKAWWRCRYDKAGRDEKTNDTLSFESQVEEWRTKSVMIASENSRHAITWTKKEGSVTHGNWNKGKAALWHEVCLSVCLSVLLVGLCQGQKHGGGVIGSKCQKQDKRIRIESYQAN